MTLHKLRYELSAEADHDLEDIFDYTTASFGAEQAVKYLSELEDLFENLCLYPKSGRHREEIRKELYSISKNNHIVFYRITKESIRIVRVLHASRDIIKFLPPS